MPPAFDPPTRALAAASSVADDKAWREHSRPRLPGPPVLAPYGRRHGRFRDAVTGLLAACLRVASLGDGYCTGRLEWRWAPTTDAPVASGRRPAASG